MASGEREDADILMLKCRRASHEADESSTGGIISTSEAMPVI
jgi:hypothetical protein